MPSWTADGTHLVFHSRRKDAKQHGIASRNIWMVAADGRDERQLTKGTKDEYHPALSPDGKKLLFVSELNGSGDIWIADPDGQNAVPLTDDRGTEDQPAWSPDGRQIVYAAFPKEGGSFDLWLMYADGSGRRRLTTTPANEIFPAWHPSGDTIAYVTDVNGNFDIYSIDVRDGRTAPLVVPPDHEARPAWSRDGTKLAFARWPARGRTSDATPWVANADGTAPIELAAAPAPALHPAWSPDGRTLAFQHRGEKGWEIWTLGLPADGIAQLSLRAGRGGASPPAAFRALMRNGDSLLVTGAFAPLRLRVGGRTMELAAGEVERIDFTEAGNKAEVVLRSGDRVSGELVGERLPPLLAAGPPPAGHPSRVRALNRAGGP